MQEADETAARELAILALLGDGAECAEIGISIYDDDGRIVAVNDHAARLLGRERSEILTYDIAAFTPGGIDRSLLDSPNRREGVRVVTRKDGSRFAAAFVVVSTRIASIAYYAAFWWELDPDDPRAADAR
jgi:PAS domain S-box-containing protein